MSDVLLDLFRDLDAVQLPLRQLQSYATANQPLSFISPESRRALGNRLARMAINIPGLVVSSIGERCRVTGFSDPRAWNLFVACELDQLAPQAVSDALTYSCGYILVWKKNGKPTATVESPFDCTVLRDPADRTVVAGLKRYSTKDETHAYVYLRDRVEHWVAPTTGATGVSGFTLREVVEHDLGVCPLVPIDNGRSEIVDVLSLTDALVKLTTDMMVTSEATGRPRRHIAGLELTEKPRFNDDGSPAVGEDGEQIVDTVSPIDLDNAMIAISENPETRFGQWEAADLAGFKSGIEVIVSMIAAVSSLPSHYLSPLTAAQVPSADGLRASEASLIARAESRQLALGRALEMVGKLLVALDTNGRPDQISLRVQWAPADTRSQAAEMDAAVKGYASGLLSRTGTLKRLGLSDDAIEQERIFRRQEALDGQGITLPRATPADSSTGQSGAIAA